MTAQRSAIGRAARRILRWGGSRVPGDPGGSRRYALAAIAGLCSLGALAVYVRRRRDG